MTVFNALDTDVSLILKLQQAQANLSLAGSIELSDEKNSNEICTVVYPQVFHPVNSCYRMTRVDQMTVDETAIWIWTCCYFFGWEEAERYSTTFRENQIFGEVLPLVTDELMKDDLLITNPTHRSVIKSVISLLFPDMEKEEYVDPGLFQTEPKLIQCQQESKLSEAETESECCSMVECCISVNAMSNSCPSRSSYSLDSCYSRTSSSLVGRSSSLGMSPKNESMKEKEYPHLRSKQLILTLQPEQRVCSGQITLLEKRFAELNYNVEVKRIDKKGKSFVVDFEDRRTALNALAKADAIGYKLSKNRTQRPNPKNLVRYKALSNLTVREGKSFKLRKIGQVMKNEVIIVNQMKGRRARIVDVQNGKPVNFGWVSLRSSEGIALMERLEEINE